MFGVNFKELISFEKVYEMFYQFLFLVFFFKGIIENILDNDLRDFIGDFFKGYLFYIVVGKYQDLKYIFLEIMVFVLNGKFVNFIKEFVIIDC